MKTKSPKFKSPVLILGHTLDDVSKAKYDTEDLSVGDLNFGHDS